MNEPQTSGMGVTKRARELLAFIGEAVDHTGVSPSFDEMKMALGLKSKSGVHRLICQLEERGHIVRLANRARAIEVKRPLKRPEPIFFPQIGEPSPKARGPAFDRLGPFAPDLSDAQRKSRFMALRDVVPSRLTSVRTWLYLASMDESAIPGALAALNGLPTLDRRHILSRYGAKS